jgi:hypothetical protein
MNRPLNPALYSVKAAGSPGRIAVGFGTQSLVKDIFSGLLFLIDDAFRIKARRAASPCPHSKEKIGGGTSCER